MSLFPRSLLLLPIVAFALNACSSDGEAGFAKKTTTTPVTEAPTTTLASTTIAPTSTLPDRTSPETRERFFVALRNDDMRSYPGVWEEALDVCARLDSGWTMQQFSDTFMSMGDGVVNFDMATANIFYAAVEAVCPEHWAVVDEWYDPMAFDK